MPVAGSHLSAHRHLERVIVSVPMRIVAFAVDRAILLFGQAVGVQPMRGGENVAPSEVRLHGSP